MDIGLSVIAYKKKGGRIDVDADDLIYHLKVGTYVYVAPVTMSLFNNTGSSTTSTNPPKKLLPKVFRHSYVR